MDTLHILYLEDSPDDVFLARKLLEDHQLTSDIVHVTSEKEFIAAIDNHLPDIILADHALPGFSCDHALQLVKAKCPHIPFIVVSGSPGLDAIRDRWRGEIHSAVSKNHPEELVTAIHGIQSTMTPDAPGARAGHFDGPVKHLVDAVQKLSLARDLDAIMSIVRVAARELTGADGATFVLRDGDQCYYAEENAISPLWKGMRFPLSICISGWVMLNKQTASIEDIYADPRIPADAYKPTFVKSLVMVPVRTEAPIAAIGNYWATQHKASAAEIEWLQALANTTAVAMENVQVYTELEDRVATRTRQLEEANRELEAFSYSVSHDLRAPLRAVNGYSALLMKEYPDTLDDRARHYLQRIDSESKRMATLIDDLLALSGYSRALLKMSPTHLGSMAEQIVARIQDENPDRAAHIVIHDEERIDCDAGLIGIVLENLLSNAWKYCSKQENTAIEFRSRAKGNELVEYTVKDNGAGFDMQYADKLFTPFQRLHGNDEFEGTGIGLATVRRIIHRHGGEIRAQSAPGRGAVFSFTLPRRGKVDKL